MGQYFKHLRTVPWNPTFKWVDSIAEAADMINRPHEDYPIRIPITHLAIDSVALPIIGSLVRFSNKNLLNIHNEVFKDTYHRGKFREVNVRVGFHIPPDHSQVPSLMEELHSVHSPLRQTEEALIDWYADVETIHPFQDGNGRVGGIVVAQYSHLWFPEKGWMASQQ